jgi:membrane protein DedA with SNARE-associated domain
VDSWVMDVVREGGLAGVALLMFLENVFPPLPSEVVMPLAGYLSARGGAGFGATGAAGCVGSLAGAVFWYGVGRAVTHDRLCRWADAHGTWLAMTPKDVDGAIAWFERHGPASVFIGRLVPFARSLVSVPAGFARMPLPLFLALSALGTTLWTAGLTYAGLVLGSEFEQVERYVGPVSTAIVLAALAAYLYRVARILAARRSGARAAGGGSRDGTKNPKSGGL